MSDGIENVFSIADQKIQEYPNDVKLIHTLALTLQGTMMMVKVNDTDKKNYDFKIQKMYERVGNSGNSKYANKSNYMLASRAIQDKKYEYAQELIDRLPEYDALDKKLLQANLWMETDKEKEAQKVYASKTLAGLNQIQIPLMKLIQIAARSGDTENASQLVTCGVALTKAFGMWNYNSFTFAFEKAMAEKNFTDTIKIIDQMLDAMLIPRDISNCPIYKHMGNENNQMDLGKEMLGNVLDEIESSEKYDFLRQEKAFYELIKKYRDIIDN